MLCELLAQDKLPAILFYVDEKGCVELTCYTLDQMESAEEKKGNRPDLQGQKENQCCEKMSMKKNPRKKGHYPKR